MIQITEKSFGLEISVCQDLNIKDFKQIEDAIIQSSKNTRNQKISILIDLTNMIDFTLDMALEEIKFMRTHGEKIDKVAIIVDDVWNSVATHIASFLSNVHCNYFDHIEPAWAWLENEDSGRFLG
jgi:hypothetical protein